MVTKKPKGLGRGLEALLGPAAGSTLALAHNGNLTNTRELMDAVHATSGEDLSGELGRGSSTDTAVLAALLNLVSEHGALEGWDSAADILTSGITDDAELDALHRRSFQMILDPAHDLSRQQVIDAVLMGRFLERFGDHSTSVASRVAYLVSGASMPETHDAEDADALH